MKTETITIIISVLAFVSSVISYIINYFQNKKNTYLSLQSRYYEKIFDNYLIEEIPSSREYIKFINNKMVDVDKLIDTLDKMKHKALYFKYNNGEFYKKITETIDDLTKYLADSSNNNCIDQDQQSEIICSIRNKITILYEIINKYSAG